VIPDQAIVQRATRIQRPVPDPDRSVAVGARRPCAEHEDGRLPWSPLVLVGTCGTSLTSLACEKLRGRLGLAAVEERPNGAGGFLDADRWWWITEDDDLNTLGDQRSVRRRGAGTGGHIAWPMLIASTVTARNLYCGSLLDSWLVHPSALCAVLVCIL